MCCTSKLRLVGSLSLAAAVFMLPAESNGQAEPTKKEQTEPLEVEKVLYLVHPHIYEGVEKNNPQGLRDGNYQIYRRREKICQQRWIEAIDRLGPGAIFTQLYGAQKTLQYAREKLGDRRVIAPSAAWHKELPMNEYHDRLAESFREQLKAKNLQMDLDSVAWELAGESFEGCVYAYGSGMASSLGLKKPPVIRFDLCVPDARFLCKAELVDTFAVDGTDVRAYAFDGPEGYPIAIFLPSFRDSPARNVTLELSDFSKLSVVNKCGITLFSRKGGRGCPGPDRDHGGISVTDKKLRIQVGPSWYILGRMVSKEEFLAAIRGAKIVSKK